MTASDLERLRTDIPGCELIVLADIRTNTVLAWNGALRLPQEHLDTLCDLACEIFAASPGGAGETLDTAVLARATGCRTFVRSIDDPSEVLCAVLAASADAEAAIAACGAFLEPGSRGDRATVH